MSLQCYLHLKTQLQIISVCPLCFRGAHGCPSLPTILNHSQGVGSANVFGSHFEVHMVRGIWSDTMSPPATGNAADIVWPTQRLGKGTAALMGGREEERHKEIQIISVQKRWGLCLKKKMVHTGKEMIAQFWSTEDIMEHQGGSLETLLLFCYMVIIWRKTDATNVGANISTAVWEYEASCSLRQLVRIALSRFSWSRPAALMGRARKFLDSQSKLKIRRH